MKPFETKGMISQLMQVRHGDYNKVNDFSSVIYGHAGDFGLFIWKLMELVTQRTDS